MSTKSGRTPIVLALLCLLSLAACTGREDGVTVDDNMLSDEADGVNWPAYGRTFSENHYSPLDQINATTVSKLALAWSYEVDTPLRADSQPLAVDGVIYLATGLSVVQAIDAESGKPLWRYDPQLYKTIDARKSLPSWGIRGLAIWKDKVIVGLQDGRLVAVNRGNGKLLWSTQTLDQKADKFGEATITGAPRVFNGKVIIGFAGAERWARGAVSAFDVETGKRLWRFFTVPGNPAEGFESKTMEMAARTWSGQWWKFGGGGTVWNSIVYDPDFNRIYFGTGNAGPWNWKVRNPEGRDQLFLASIVAVDADTGHYVWHYQQNPNEAWDYNATMDIELATLSIAGKQRKVLMQAPKNGYFYVLDRANGRLISAEKIGRVTWSSGIDGKTGRPIDVPGNRYEHGPVIHWPGTFGTHNWQPMSYSPATNLAYIPTIRQADIYSSEGVDPKTWEPKHYSWNTAMGADTKGLKIDTDEFGSFLQAWDPVANRPRWKVPTPGIVNGGTMATAGGLVFQGHMDGTFNAFSAEQGKKLWAFRAGVSVLGAPISFSAGGQQYVAVLSAPPSGAPSGSLPMQAKFGWRYHDHPKRLLVFKLGGTATLPETLPPGAAQPLTDTGFRVDATKAKSGHADYSNFCEACHGVGAIASGGAPDLRASGAVLDAKTFEMIVRGGALSQNGMPRVDFVTDDQLLGLRSYIRQRAEAKDRAQGAAAGP
jgi:quinohemoprotein ethanol dehydrogenase